MSPTVDNEAVREALINLDRSREKERVLREQANNLLEGLEIITSATGTADMLGRLLQMVTDQLQCDDAFILSPAGQAFSEGGQLECIGSTHPLFAEQRWVGDKVFTRVLGGSPVMLFSVERVAEWIAQPDAVREQTGSVLLISFPGVDRSILICCVSRQRAYFNKTHLGLMQRLMPITSHALHTLYINEQLQREIDERNRLEQYASFQAGIAEMSASVLHNIGNTITGAQGHLIKLDHQRRTLLGLNPIFKRVEGWMEEGALDEEKISRVLKVLQGVTGMLEEVVGDDGSMVSGIQAVERSTHHVAEIIQMQRGVSRPVLTASRFSIQQMIEDTLGMIEESIEKRGVEVEVEVDDGLKVLFLPRNPMIQMLLNLVKNSVESIEERTQEETGLCGRILIRILSVGEQFELMVEDNGIGVEEERIDAIFKFGVTSKERGSGFGLNSVANFVKSVEGEIRLESDGRNQGARMIVQMPIEIEAADV